MTTEHLHMPNPKCLARRTFLILQTLYSFEITNTTQTLLNEAIHLLQRPQEYAKT